MSKRDYYETLGISKNATESDIKSAFRKLSRKYHPDMQSGKSDDEKKQAEEKFKEIAEAYEVLSDKDKRANYDQFGFDSGSAGGFSNMDMREFMRRHASMFGGMFGGFESAFNGFDFGSRFGNATTPAFDMNQPEDGDDVQTNVTVSFKESINGCVKEFDLNLTKPCNECKGTGCKNDSTPTTCQHCHGKGRIITEKRMGFMMSQTISECPYCHGIGKSFDVCTKCHGQKRIPHTQHIKVKVPAGINAGQRLRVVGAGHCGVKGGSDGNLYVNIDVVKNSLFDRRGLDVMTQAHIDPITAAIGGSIDVMTPYKHIMVSIPKGIESGHTIKVKNNGISTKSGSGDLYVTVVVDTPTKLNAIQETKLKELASALNDSNYPKFDAYRQSVAEYEKE